MPGPLGYHRLCSVFPRVILRKDLGAAQKKRFLPSVPSSDYLLEAAAADFVITFGRAYLYEGEPGTHPYETWMADAGRSLLPSTDCKEESVEAHGRWDEYTYLEGTKAETVPSRAQRTECYTAVGTWADPTGTFAETAETTWMVLFRSEDSWMEPGLERSFMAGRSERLGSRRNRSGDYALSSK